MGNVNRPGAKERRWPRLPDIPVTRRNSPNPSALPARHHAILSAYGGKNRDHSEFLAFNAIAHGIPNQFIHRNYTANHNISQAIFHQQLMSISPKLHFNQF